MPATNERTHGEPAALSQLMRGAPAQRSHRAPRPRTSDGGHDLVDRVMQWNPGSATYGVDGVHVRSEPGRGRRALARVVAAALVAPCLLVLGCGWYGAQAAGADELRREARADRFVHQTIDAIAAWSFESVVTLDGASLLENTTREHSDFRVDLAVTPARSGLLEVQAVLRDNRTSREMARFVTYRGRS
jgi:hypothetical protein